EAGVGCGHTYLAPGSARGWRYGRLRQPAWKPPPGGARGYKRGDAARPNLLHADRFDVQQLTDAGHKLIDVERLLHELVGASVAEFLNLLLLDHAGDADDADIVHRRVAADEVADFLAIDIWEHDVENDQIGAEFLDHHAGA